MSLRSRLFSLGAFALTLSTLFTTSLSAQQPKVLAPHKPVEPIVTPQPGWHFRAPTQRSMVGGLWMIDANFRSAIYLKNGVENAPITVTPVLYLSNGKGFTLPDVKLEPSGTAIVNINDELSKQGIASWATLSGYVEVRYTWAWDPLCVTVQNVDVAHSLIFAYFLRPAPLDDHVQPPAPERQQIQTLEGMWWKQENNVTGFVALSNTLAQPVSANVVVGDSQGKPMMQHRVTVSPHGTKVVKLNEMQSAPSAEGGITVTYQGPMEGLQVNGGLEDPGNGYSTTLRFHSPPSPSAKPPAGGYAELGLMAGAADPMMAFPAGTVFTPYSVIRNTTARPIAVTPVLWWMAGAPRSARLPQFVLPARSTTSLPVSSLLAQAGLKNYNGSLNLILEADTKPGALLLDSGSVDQTNTYVFEVVPQGIGESMAKSLSYWSTGKGDDTMITVWNPADEAQDFVFTLFFSGGSYKYPMPLGPRETRTFDISAIIHSQIPDADGNVVPIGVHEGSAKISGSRAEHERILVGIAVGVYNVQKATCPPQCTKCDTADDAEFDFDPFDVVVGGTTAERVVITMTSGTVVDASASATWKSSNTAVATVSSGTVKGESPGTITLSATTTEDWPYGGFNCGDGCPVAPVSPPPASGTSLLVTITIQSSGTIPSADTARGEYYDVVGSYNLGNLVDSGGYCTIGYQATGALDPSSYSGTVTLVRTKTGVDYDGTTGQTVLDSYPSGTNDSSEAAFEVTTPTNGVVYDLDAPGVKPSQNQIWRKRMNFFENAQLPDGTYVANEVGFYVRLSCVWGSSGNAFGTGVSGDNVLGMGTTNTTWNLQ